MYRKKKTRAAAGVLAAAMTVSAAVSLFAPLTASAAENHQLLAETDFDYKMLPWHTVETSPAKQDFDIDDGTAHIRILVAKGLDGAEWDLQFRYRKLDFQEGHSYKVSCKVKASRDGLLLNSHIGDTANPYNQYCTLQPQGFVNGPHMGGGGLGWGHPVELTTEWQTFEGTFDCTEDMVGKEWTFQYAYGERGNATDGDEIWFDEMSIEDLTAAVIPPEPVYYGRKGSPVPDNYISVNQLGYVPRGTKIAVLGDDKGDTRGVSDSIELTGNYTYELVNTKTNAVAYTGTTGNPVSDIDSGDTVCRIDFSEFQTPGRYFLRIKDQEWRSLEFEIGDIYADPSHDLLTNALNFFYQNRSGMDISSQYITSGDKVTLARRGSHMPDTGYVQKEWRGEYLSNQEATATYASSRTTANGGWLGSGDTAKYMTEGGMALWTLQNMYERAGGAAEFQDNSGLCVVPETGNNVPDILDECKYELDFMQQMKVDASEPTWGEYAGLYYHKIQDHKWVGLATKPWIYEEEWETARIVKPPTFSATLSYAACAAQAARLWQNYDADYAASLLKSAQEAYYAFQKYYYEADHRMTTHPFYRSDVEKEEINPTSLYAPLVSADIWEHYGDTEVLDDAYWAACEIFISSKMMGDEKAADFLSELSESDWAFKVPQRISGGENMPASQDGSVTVFNWGNTAAAGSFSLALHKDLISAAQKETLEKSIIATADYLLNAESTQGYGIPYLFDSSSYGYFGGLSAYIWPEGFEFGSNARALNNMIALAYAYDLTLDAKYNDGVMSGMNYLLGCNPLSLSYITGYGSYSVKYPYHNYWSYVIDDTFPSAPDGVIVGGPTVVFDKYMRAFGFTDQKPAANERCYLDDIEARNCNAISLEWNASLAWIASYLQFGKKLPEPPVTLAPQAETTVGTTGAPSDLWGDVSCDGITDVSDAVLLARYLTQDTEAVISDQGKLNANVIKGSLDSKDITAILMFIAKKIAYDQFPLESLPGV